MSSSSIPRPVLIVAIGVVLVAAVFFLTRGKGNDSSSDVPPLPEPAAKTPSSDSAKQDSASGKSKSADSTATKSDASSKSKASEDSATTNSGDTSSSAGADDDRGLPKPVKKAIDQNKVVVLLFWRPQGVDDRSVYQSVQGLRGRSKNVRVFTEGVGDIDRYVSIVGIGGVTQTPTLVIVDRDGQADTQTGYLDEKTIENSVFNAL